MPSAPSTSCAENPISAEQRCSRSAPAALQFGSQQPNRAIERFLPRARQRGLPARPVSVYNGAVAEGNRDPMAKAQSPKSMTEAELPHPRRTREKSSLALELDDPSRQSHPRKHRRAEGRRPPGVLRLARRDHDGALFPCAAPAGSRRREAARVARTSTRSSICSASRRARSSRRSAATRARRAIPRAPKTPTTWISRLARSAWASRRRCSPRSSRITCARTSRATPEGRMVALVGDAEMDEGNIFEAMLEGWKQGLRNCWWVIDYNRQSLDAVIREGPVGALRGAVQGVRLGRRDRQAR